MAATFEACPKCGSKDNVAVYEDHKWCFTPGCGYYVRLGEPIQAKFRGIIPVNNVEIELPDDFSYDIGIEGYEWLKKYSLSSSEIVGNRIGWSQNGWLRTIKGTMGKFQMIRYAPLLIFPIWDPTGNLIMWQARYFGKDEAPKAYTKGNVKDCLHIIQPPTREKSNDIVLVEDIISAIKCGRHIRAVPLWGSHISNETINRLRRIAEQVTIWLDPDAQKYARKVSKQLSLYFNNVRVISSVSDPKDYNEPELGEILCGK